MPAVGGSHPEGYWGKTSSTLDWCEENYVVSHYIAEFWNTISNLMMIVPPLIFAIQGLQRGVEARLIMCHFSLFAVGLGSWCFHMTLLYTMQLMDELPMIWGSIFLLYSILEIEKPLFSRNHLLQVGLIIYSLVVTVIYLLNKSPLFFQTSYALMVLGMVLGILKVTSRYGWRLKVHFQLLALGTYGLGIILWLIDNHYCSSIRTLRDGVGAPLGYVTQLHAWWHICAGFGTYMGILFGFHSRYLILNQNPKIKFAFGVWPYLILDKPLKRV